ncbi:hypothetical protein JKP88DRAFT_228004, partial [Tribonema minus]
MHIPALRRACARGVRMLFVYIAAVAGASSGHSTALPIPWQVADLDLSKQINAGTDALASGVHAKHGTLYSAAPAGSYHSEPTDRHHAGQQLLWAPPRLMVVK